MSEYIEKVHDFNMTAYGNEFKRTNTPLLLMQEKICKEELEELRNALEEENVVEILDGICDSIYVLVGMHILYYRWGKSSRALIDIERVISKKRELVYDLYKGNRRIEITASKARIKRYIGNYEKRLNAWFDKINSDENPHSLNFNGMEIIDCLLETLIMLAILYNCDIEKALYAVHENNMSKFKDGVIHREDGKILKPKGYVRVDLTPYVGTLFNF